MYPQNISNMPWHPQGLGYLGFADAAGTCWDCPPWPKPTWACRNALGASEPQLQRFSLSLSPKADPSPAGPALKALLLTRGMLRRTRAAPALQTGTQSLKTLINVLCLSSSSSSAPPGQAAVTRLPWRVFVQHPEHSAGHHHDTSKALPRLKHSLKCSTHPVQLLVNASMSHFWFLGFQLFHVSA